MRRRFFLQCAFNGIAAALFGGVIVILCSIPPQVAAPTPMPLPSFEDIFEAYSKGARGTPIPPKTVPTVRILEPDEIAP